MIIVPHFFKVKHNTQTGKLKKKMKKENRKVNGRIDVTVTYPYMCNNALHVPLFSKIQRTLHNVTKYKFKSFTCI